MIPLTVDRIAHGGHCVGRHEGQVVFVRHAIPGETVRAEITGSGPRGRYLFADVVEVITPSPQRVTPECDMAGLCGGCDFQHIAEAHQRELKAQVISEQFSRLADLDRPVEVQAVPRSGSGWRTRTRFAADREGGWGLRRHADHEVVCIETCPISMPGINRRLAGLDPGQPGAEVLVVDQPHQAVFAPVPTAHAPEVHHEVADRHWTVSADLFWQVHVSAPETLVQAVAPYVSSVTAWWDLYCGVGLLAGSLATPRQQVMAVEGDRRAADQAALNLSDLPAVRVFAADVGRWLAAEPDAPVEVIVLDPPRKGAGKGVVTGLTRTSAHTLVYVACDPATLARDAGLLIRQGWEVDEITGFDLFPMTHHVETVAVLRR